MSASPVSPSTEDRTVTEQNEQQKTDEFQFHEKILELTRELEQARGMKEKERSIKDLEAKLQERDREIEQLKAEVASNQEQLKRTTVELLGINVNEKNEKIREQADKIESLQDELEATRLQNEMLKEKIVTLVDDISAAEVKISQYEEKCKEEAVTATNKRKEPKKKKKQDKRTARDPTESVSLPAELTSSAAATGQSEEEQILTAQVNAYSRECDKLKRQLATANEEIDSLRKQLKLCKDDFQARTHDETHVSTLATELNKERCKTASLEIKLDEIKTASEKTRSANSTLREKLNTAEVKMMRLQKILEARDVQSAPATMTQEPQEATDNSPAVCVLNMNPVISKQLSDERETLPEVKLDLLPVREKSSTLKALEAESERKRREADKALQEIEETRRELLNLKVNFGDTGTDDSGYPLQSPVQSNEQLIDIENGTVMNEQELVAERRLVVTDSPSANANSELTAGLTQTPATDDTDTDNEPWPENKLIEGIDQEIQYYANEVRQMSRRPDTAEVERSDKHDPLPYDPNLVCPKCGKRYRIGGVQKFRRHVKELCTANSSP